MEGKLVYKNRGYHRLCFATIIISSVVAVAYIIFSIINIKYSLNYPRFFCRAVLLAFYTVEFCLFAHRNSVYMEIGGDFAMARRSAMLMIVFIVISAIVEAYYVSSAYGMLFGRYRIIYMCVIIGIGAASTLALIQFEYFNIDVVTMYSSGIISICFAFLSFSIGFLTFGIRDMRASILTGAADIVGIAARVVDSLAPVFFIHVLSSIVLMYTAKVMLIKEMKLNAKLSASTPGEKDENIEDY